MPSTTTSGLISAANRASPANKFVKVRSMTAGIAQIAKDTGLTRQTVYRIKEDPAGAEAALAAWGQ
jgi:DNA invertase Pin-like site-specific DNA recombinase